MQSRRLRIPLRRRKVDACIIVFFSFNLMFVSYMFNPEQIVYKDANLIEYKAWPPSYAVKAAHWWGRHFDPALIARPAWRVAAAWIDLLLFGPFYLFAIYAYIDGREWVRLPSLLYAAAILTIMTMIIAESFFGDYATPYPFIHLAVHIPWIVFPIIILIRMWKPNPFTVEAPVTLEAPTGREAGRPD